MPNLNRLLSVGLAAIREGGTVATLDYLWPDSPKVVCDDGQTRAIAQEVAVMAVGTGRNSRARWFIVWEIDPNVKPSRLPFDADVDVAESTALAASDSSGSD